MSRFLRQWWTKSNDELLLRSQQKLLETLVTAPIVKTMNPHDPSGGGLNGVEFRSQKYSEEVDKTCILAHGFGSGLGFYFRNIDPLLQSGKFNRVLLFDWLGMGGSARPSCRQRPIRSMLNLSICHSRFTPAEAVHFFIDPLETFLEHHNISNTNQAVLVGHSMGGYLAARYALRFASSSNRLQALVLASPVGLPSKPSNFIPRAQLSPGLRLVDTLWSANVTPQQLVRLMGATRGRRNVQRALRGRIPHLSDQDLELLAEYLYHVTVAHPSGEFAMNSLLEPVASVDAVGVFAREALEEELVEKLPSELRVKVLFGAQDWMRSKDNEESAREVARRRGLEGNSVHLIANAGHHLYVDAGEEFVRHVVTC